MGLLKALPQLRAHAFDPSPSARRLCLRLAETNAVSQRLSVHSRTTTSRVKRLVETECVVLCDCEGCELEIFQDTLVHALRSSIVVIELHEPQRPGVSVTLQRRFERSHVTSTIFAGARKPGDYGALNVLPHESRELAPSEFRSERAAWLVLTPRQGLPETTQTAA